MHLENLSKEFLKLEFEKNYNVNYIVRCMEVGDEEEFQILYKTFEETQIANENIPLEIREIVNNKLERCINGFQNEDINEELILIELEEVSNLLKPYITWPELFETNFNAWVNLLLEDYDSLEEDFEEEEWL